MPDTPDQVPATADVRRFVRQMFHATTATPAPATVDDRPGAHVVPGEGGNPRPPDDPTRSFVRRLFGADDYWTNA